MTSKAAQKQAETNILTFLRIRPSKKPSGYFNVDEMDENSMKFLLPENLKLDFVNNSKIQHGFHFNGIIDMKATQEDVFKRVGSAAVQNALDGFNSTIFAYGQTGSGKTFTLTGGPERYADRGIIPRSISMLFNEVRSRTDIQLKIYISYLELYNETGYDLLDPSHETKALEDLPKVSMLEDMDGNFVLKNLSVHPAETEEDALELLFMGDTNRAIAETPMNMASSRSHCVFSLQIEGRIVGSDVIRRSKLNLVDLAGSERVGKTNSSGSVLTEAKYINSSLFFLEMVIVALYEKATKGRTHIPYRNSMMTSVLRDSLGGNCKTIMIATINPEASHTEESLSTCRFAQRVSLIKNKATINEIDDPSMVIRRLKNEILQLREEIGFLKGEAGEGEALTPQDIDDLQTKCQNYCDNPDPYAGLNIGKLSLTKIKDAFAIFKNIVLETRAKSAQQNGNSSHHGGNKMLLDDGELLSIDASKQVKDLKSMLLQRDNEISILVSMVKNGKSVDDVRSSSGATSRTGGGGGGRMDDEEDESAQSMSTHRRNDNLAAAKEQRAKGSQPPSMRPSEPPISAVQQQQQREMAREEKILKRHLFGVPPPVDQATFDDAAASFEWFRERCSLNASMEENRDLLKNKITEAKTLGERVNQSRATISYLKNSIEAIRREQALRRIDHDNSDTKGGPDGEEESGATAESPEEQTYRRAIEQEKAVYKEGFERLRILKPEIEHIRKIMEKCRLNMQNQFDQWYNTLHSRGGMVGAFSGITNNPGSQGLGQGSQYTHETETIHGHDDNQYYHQSQLQLQTHTQSQAQSQAHPHPSRSPRNYDHNDRNSSSNNDGYHNSHNSHSNHYRSNDEREREHKSGNSGGNESGGGSVHSQGSNRDARDHMRRSNSGPASSSYSVDSSSGGPTMPSIITTTSAQHRKREHDNIPHVNGDHQSSSDVNEDIMAFYQAKEELLKRRGQGGGGGAAR